MRTILYLLLFVSASCVQAQETVERYAFKTYMGYVWNPATRQFYRVPEFENMQEVDIDSKTKTITSRIRTTTGICIDTYKWKNGKLNKISTKNI